MDPNPPAYIQLRLPRGEHPWYHPTNTDVPELVREIRAQRYTVWFFDINVVGLQRQQLPQAEWLQAVVLGRFILFIAIPAGGYTSSGRGSEGHSDSVAGSSSEQGSDSTSVDSDNVDPDTADLGGAAPRCDGQTQQHNFLSESFSQESDV